ncbi:MAG: hypothetical protein R3C01_15000 [Planctomycetaceae bacterium]
MPRQQTNDGPSTTSTPIRRSGQMIGGSSSPDATRNGPRLAAFLPGHHLATPLSP